jgi:hypothetical protein
MDEPEESLMSDLVYKMPPITLGAIVLWYPNGVTSVAPLPAVVTRLNFRSVGLSIIAPDTHNFLLRDGVRHIDDPELKRDIVRNAEEGAWEYTEQHQLLEKALNELSRRGGKVPA